MATVVPVSHSQRWRSRSRNQSADAMSMSDLHIHVPADRNGHEEELDDEEEHEFDDLQTSPWLVVPQGFVSPVQQRTSAGQPASPAQSWQKAMEMRRATGF